jgi:hypothetical protein
MHLEIVLELYQDKTTKCFSYSTATGKPVDLEKLQKLELFTMYEYSQRNYSTKTRSF